MHMFKDTVIGLISLIEGWVFFIRIDTDVQYQWQC